MHSGCSLDEARTAPDGSRIQRPERSCCGLIVPPCSSQVRLIGVSTPKPWVTVGVDVGKQRDPATIAITTAERHATPTGRSTVLWIVRSLEKLPLGTDYPKVADRIRDICFVLRERYTKPRFVYLDATGVGAAICDMLVERRVEHVPCTFVVWREADRALCRYSQGSLHLWRAAC